MGLLSSSCLPEGHPPQSPRDLDTFTDSVADIQKSGESYIDSNHSEINGISSPDSSYDSVEYPLDLIQYSQDSSNLETMVKDSLNRGSDGSFGEILPDSYDTLQQDIVDVLDLTEDVSETKNIAPSFIPYQPDDNTWVLLNFDEPNQLQNLGVLVT